MRRILVSLLAALASLASLPALASQAGGCMPTTGTYTGLTAAGYINAGFSALFSANSGASPPANACGGNPVAGQLWLDTSGTNQPLSVYDGTQWLTVGTLDTTGHRWLHPPFPTQLLAADGTASAPGISFQGDPNTGIVRTGDGAFDLVSNGVAKLSVSPTGVNMPSFSGIAQGQVRLDLNGSNLLLYPYGGNQLTINGVNQTVPSAGVSLPPTGLAVGTLYYIYAFMSGPAMALEPSPTAYVRDGNGWMIKSGDASRTLVGMVVPVAGPAFSDTYRIRYVASWFNKLPRAMYAQDCCGNINVSQTSLAIFDGNAIIYWISWSGLATSTEAVTAWDLPDNGVNSYVLLTTINVDGSNQTGYFGIGYWYSPSINTFYVTTSHQGTVMWSEGGHSAGTAAQVTGGTAVMVNLMKIGGMVWQ